MNNFQNFWNSYLEWKTKLLNGPGNYRELRETGLWRLIVNKYTGDDWGRVWNMWQSGKRKIHKITRSSFRQIRIEKYITPFASVIANRNQTFSIHCEGTHHKTFVQSRRMSFILRYVRAALATTDVKSIISILEIPVPDEIHMEDRNHGLAWTNRAKLWRSKFSYLDQ